MKAQASRNPHGPCALEQLEPRLLLSGLPTGEVEFWRVMPIRSEAEYDLGMIGGEGEQWMQGLARSQSDPDVIYLSHDVGQVWRSDDNGNTWHRTLCHGMPVIAGQSIEVDPTDADIVFAVMDDSYNYYVENYQGLYRSTDGGENWTMVLHPTHDPMVQRLYQHNIAYDPASVTGSGAARWYAAFPADSTGTSGTGACLYRSEDYGATWTKVRNNLTSELGIQTIYEIQTHPTDGNTLYMCTEDGLFVSPDRGATLTLVSGGGMPAGKAVRSLNVHPTTTTTLYAAVYLDGLYRSTNGGATWTELYNYNYTIRAFMNPAYPDVMYVMPSSTPGRNLMVTTNGGTSWTKINYTVPAPGLGREYKLTIRGNFCAILPDPRSPTAAVAQSTACLWRTTDGLNWADSSTLLTGFAASWYQDSFEFNRFDPNQITLFCCDVGMIYTANAGQWFTKYSVRSLYDAGLISWSGMHSGDTQPIDGSQIIVASAGKYWSLKLVRSTDGGASWSVVNDNVQNYFFIEFHPDDPNLVFAGDQKSTDAGATWTTIQYLANRSAAIFGMCEAHPDTLYAIDGDRNEIYRSDDRGVTWRSYTGQVSWRFYGMDSKPTFICDPVNPDIIYARGSTRDLARFDGTSWTNLGVLPLAGGSAYHNYVRTVAIDPRHPEIIHVGMHSAGLESLWRSTDGGATWQSISYNLPQSGASAIAVNPHTGDLMYGSCFGTWLFPPPYDSPDSLYNTLGLAGDFDADWDADADDIDVLSGAIRNGITHGLYDLNGDSEVNQADKDMLVRDIIGTQYGDATMDKHVSLADLGMVGTYWGLTGQGWAHGDLTGDGVVSLADLGMVGTYWGWTPEAETAAVASATGEPLVQQMDPVASQETWQSFPIDEQTGVFRAEFDATPDAGNIDGVTGLLRGEADSWTDMACIFRFYTNGFMDVRNGGAYMADAAVPYSAGVTYHVRMDIDISSHTYSVRVTPAGGEEISLATDYAFRAEQSDVTSLDHWALLHWQTDGFAVSNFTVGLTALTADAGPDQTITDADEDGAELVTLDGTGSGDPDGTIVDYTWTEGGSVITDGPTPDASFALGQHTATLTVTDNDGNTDDDIVLITVQAPAVYSTFYVDPVYGSMAGDGSAADPWRTLEEVFASGLVESRNKDGVIVNPGAPIKAGDMILLRSGYHGDPVLNGYHNDGTIVVAAEDGQTAELRRLRITGCTNWIFRGLAISTELSPSFAFVSSLVSIASNSTYGNSSFTSIEDCFIYSVLDTSGYSATDWVSNTSNGISLGLNGHHLTARNNRLLNVDNGIAISSTDTLVAHNEIVNFRGDGIRALNHNQTVEHNLIKNCYDVDGNHDDGIQVFKANVSQGLIRNMVLRGNTIINFEDINQPHRGAMQGIGIFEGPHENFLIENNLVITNHWHGISLYWGRDSTIINNTCYNPLYVSGESPMYTWIMITDAKQLYGGEPSTNCIVRNNIAHRISVSGDSMTVENNLVVDSTNYLDVFADPIGRDFHLADASPAIDTGTPAGAPLIDIEGSNRPAGSGWDIGAYEHFPSVAGDFNGDSHVDAADIDLLSSAMRSGPYDAGMDFDNDRDVDLNDHAYLIHSVLGTEYGDATLDRQVSLADLGMVGTYWGLTGQGWAHGDLTGDGVVSLADLGMVGTYWGWTAETETPGGDGSAAGSEAGSSVMPFRPSESQQAGGETLMLDPHLLSPLTNNKSGILQTLSGADGVVSLADLGIVGTYRGWTYETETLVGGGGAAASAAGASFWPSRPNEDQPADSEAAGIGADLPDVLAMPKLEVFAASA